MQNFPGLVRNALISGTIASAVSGAVLAMLARAEGASAVQPLNATSHWLHGEDAGRVKDMDTRHTAAGLATHHAACVLWGALFETLRAPDAGLGHIVRDAALVSGVAAALDYGIVPRRLTPGWEEALPIRSVAGGFVGLALGLAAGGLVTSRRGSFS